MLVECLIQREGPTIVDVGKLRYVFSPRPALTGGDDETSVCEVNSVEHAEYFCNIPGNLYRPYDHEERRREQEEKRLAEREALKEEIRVEMAKEAAGKQQAGSPAVTFTSPEAYHAYTNAPKLKQAIKACEDAEMMIELHKAETRPWAKDALAARLDELEA